METLLSTCITMLNADEPLDWKMSNAGKRVNNNIVVSERVMENQ